MVIVAVKEQRKVIRPDRMDSASIEGIVRESRRRMSLGKEVFRCHVVFSHTFIRA